jgi:hypothetical protein
MKTLVALVVLGGTCVLSSGCGTPGYTGKERFRQITRNWGYEWAQAQDDIDHALLLRPASSMTIWNVQSPGQ